ncbi:MAG: histidine phosphatase family protein [Clostridia bacterium]|nr:histidine phosphatase family protein [Clostridia bacterium]
MLDIYIVRHGQTQWNVEKRLQGWLDSPLTLEGERSALLLREEIGAIEFDQVFSSPSGRAITTLSIAMPEVLYVIDDRLKEICLGSWQGKTIETIEKEFPEAYYNYFFEPENFRLEGGEDYSDLHKRVSAFVDEVIERFYNKKVNKKVLIVTHGLTLMMMQLIFNRDVIANIGTYALSQNAKPVHYHYDGEKFDAIIEVSAQEGYFSKRF